MFRFFAVVVCFGLMPSSLLIAEEAFTSLFDGASLEGWVQRGGDAVYTVEPDAAGGPQIVGTSVADTPNSFLCTDRDYTDFVLEFEVKVDPSLNSGVQFRSQCYEEATKVATTNADGKQSNRTFPAGRVHGYQAEIDPSPRAWSGGVYDEGRRGWLFKLEGEKNAAARAAFKADDWNRYRIEAIGNHISTSINGVPVAHFHDDMTSSGFIALQVHGIKEAHQVNKQIRWRDIKVREITN